MALSYIFPLLLALILLFPTYVVLRRLTGILTIWFGDDALTYQAQTMEKYGRVFSLSGFLGDRIVTIADTKALYDVLVKNQDNFVQLDSIRENMRLVLGGTGLFSALGDAHRKQRKLMNPAFSINHMRRMMPIFKTLARRSVARMREEVTKGAYEIDVMDYASRLALELVSQAGFGHSFGAIEGKDHGYSRALKDFNTSASKLANGILLLPTITRLVPQSLLRPIAERLPWPALHDMLRVSDTMQTTSREIWEEKKRLFALGDKSVVNEYGEGKDIMSILLKTNLSSSKDDQVTDEELLTQINTFTLAGSDTTSNSLTRILYLLSLHAEVQERLREELTEACGKAGDIGHDDLIELPYLEAVCRETLRLYPPAHFVYRQCLEDCVLPLAHPYTDVNGKEHRELFVPGGGTMVYVSIVGVNRDKAIWGPDAGEWKPERWLSPLPDSVTEARIPGVYANLLTFIGGRSACIGFKFAQLEMKVALSQLIPAFHFAPSEKHEIIWRCIGVGTPSIKGPPERHSMLPLRVTPVA
ncbi:cytochrome P450 [Vararia minispora EC-137]|uniref:Cytochrome P450 n=1 Tax=Vararia minispora EC-137 TaxID=1314806 RepID=A0ACB8Q912_9AGAM|nr:cytochrome P450 [Vararia minispora EC-137]